MHYVSILCWISGKYFCHSVQLQSVNCFLSLRVCVWGGALNFTQSGLVILILPWAPQILYRTDCLSFYTEAFPLFQLYTNICSALRCFLHSVDHRDSILVFMSSLFSAHLLPLYNVCVCVCWVLLLRFKQLYCYELMVSIPRVYMSVSVP